MRVFHCDHCGHLLFFENTGCVNCGRRVAFLPDLRLVGSLEPAQDDTWSSPLPATTGRFYRLCRNYTEAEICNWAVMADDANQFCVSCRLTRVIPSLDSTEHYQFWYRLEVAKRRLIFTLLELGLPLEDRVENPQGGLAFEFKADHESGGAPVLTGHADGVITINLAEVDDAERERRRAAMHEPYRTLLGHMRHESGHYYWDRLVKDGSNLDEFRSLFGDEREDYDAALRRHYDQGAPSDWQARFISAYASAHPWEDWAETWAHYLHMVDTEETASACGVSLEPRRKDEPSLAEAPEPLAPSPAPFDKLIDGWFPLTYLLNNLNRGLGLGDAYPFVLCATVIEKLRYVDQVVGRGRHTGRDPAAETSSAPLPPA